MVDVDGVEVGYQNWGFCGREEEFMAAGDFGEMGLEFLPAVETFLHVPIQDLLNGYRQHQRDIDFIEFFAARSQNQLRRFRKLLTHKTVCQKRMLIQVYQFSLLLHQRRIIESVSKSDIDGVLPVDAAAKSGRLLPQRKPEVDEHAVDFGPGEEEVVFEEDVL